MLAARIFAHSVRQVAGNLLPALRVSVAPTALQYAAILLIVRVALPDAAALEAAMRAGHPPLGGMLAISLVSIFCGSWIAVAWHRFVLLGERPVGWVPRLHGERMLVYFGRSLLIGLMIALLELALGVPLLFLTGMVGAVARPVAAVGFAVGLVALIAALVTVGFRLSPMLPAAALGAASGPRIAWSATRGHGGTLLAIAVAFLAAAFAVLLVEALFSRLGLGIFALAWQVVAGWALTLVLLSLFTTVYGHFVEGRPLV